MSGIVIKGCTIEFDGEKISFKNAESASNLREIILSDEFERFYDAYVKEYIKF